MRVNSAPYFPLPGFWSDHACAEAVYTFDGQRYHVRQFDKHILYRMAGRDNVAHTLYVPCRVLPGTPARSYNVDAKPRTVVYPEAVFSEQVRGGESGRLVLYAHPAARDCLAFLLFAPDGTGKFLDYYTINNYTALRAAQSLDFSWNVGKYGIADCADILICDEQTLLPLCEDVFMQQIWPCMRDPYATYDGFPDEPLRFTCGSREELEYITRCIYQAHFVEPEESEEEYDGFVAYYAVTSRQAEASGDFYVSYYPLDALPERLYRMALAHNAFQGGTWTYARYSGNTRRESYQLEPIRLFVPVMPPSAHEQAEALLTLYDWLEGKVTEEERRQLLLLDSLS